MIKMPVRVVRRFRNDLRLAGMAASADAFLASFPKSGRTWFRFILSNYFDSVFNLEVGVDLHSMFGIVPNFDFDPVRGAPAFRFKDRQPPVPLVFVSHLFYRRLRFRTKPVIFMIRDPRDVMVSAYFHATRQKHRFSGDMRSFLGHPDHGVPTLISYLNGWAAGLPRHRHVILSYERLAADPGQVTGEVLAFLGCPIDSAALGRAIEASRFEAMRDREKHEGIPAHNYDRSDDESLRMRRGKIHGFTDYLQPEESAFIEESCAALLSPAAKAHIARTGLHLR